MTPIISRRSFLRTGLIGTLALATAGGLYRTARPADAAGKFLFDDQARAVLNAIIPVVLKDATDSSFSAATSAIYRVQKAIAGLPLTTQREIQDLFGLLTLAPSRRFLVGLPDDWPQVKQEDVAAFLNRWRLHRFMHAAKRLSCAARFDHRVLVCRRIDLGIHRLSRSDQAIELRVP